MGCVEGVHVTDVCEYAQKLRLVHDGTLLSPVCSCHSTQVLYILHAIEMWVFIISSTVTLW